MTQITATVIANLRGLTKFRQRIAAGTGDEDIKKAVLQWAYRARAFLQKRFVDFSRGGGNWPPLKHKRKRGKKESAAILRDTNTLFAVVNPVFAEQPGAIEETLPFGVKIGFGGPHQHPSGGATVADIAKFHQFGEGNLPVRKIIVPPDKTTKDAMAGDMERALARIAKRDVE